MQPWIKAMALLEWLGNRVWGRLESMLEDNQEPSAPWPWASLPPRGRCPPCNPSAASDDLWPLPLLWLHTWNWGPWSLPCSHLYCDLWSLPRPPTPLQAAAAMSTHSHLAVRQPGSFILAFL